MTDTLHTRLGGAAGIAALVDDIVEAHMNNPLINARFLPYRDDPDRIETIKRHTRDFIGMGAGGPEQYGGRSMPDAHRGMNVSAEEFLATVDDILGALDKRRVDDQSRKDVLAIVYSLKDQIVRV